MPFSNGSVYINGTEHRFIDNDINLTLGPGEYDLKVYNKNELYKTLTINLTAGEYLPLNVARKYEITFTESGLPSGTIWYVNLTDGNSYKSNNNTITFNGINGTYNYTIATLNKIYKPSHSSGSFTVKGAVVSESVTFKEVAYKITFTESGLPSGTIWYVNLTDGNSYKSNNNTITFNEINGTYNFTVSTDSNYNANITSNSFTVNGNNMNEVIAFSHHTGITGIITLIAVVAVAVGFAGFIILRKRK